MNKLSYLIFTIVLVLIPLSASATCTEHNTGDIYTKGYIIRNGKKIVDLCEKNSEIGDPLSKVLFERSCVDENTSSSKRIECEYGCEDGACLEEPKTVSGCKDEDGGSNYYERGKVMSGKWKRVDHCIDATQGTVPECSGEDCHLVEYTCEDEERPIKKEWHNCRLGCKEGVCVSCDGCITSGKCLEAGTVIEEKYCSETGEMLNLKEKGNTCTTDYQCETQNCVNNECLASCEDGCRYEGSCLSYGFVIDGKYCAESNELKDRKGIFSICSNDYECKNDSCINNVCITNAFLRRIKIYGRIIRNLM